jgi:hypothetical protein
MVDPTGNEYPTPGMDPDEPIPDDPAELDDPGSLPPPPIESTPDDPGGDPEAEPSPT